MFYFVSTFLLNNLFLSSHFYSIFYSYVKHHTDIIIMVLYYI